MNKIRNSFEDRQSRIAWQTVKDSKWKEEHIKGKTKNCLPKRETSEVERTFQESAWKPS